MPGTHCSEFYKLRGRWSHCVLSDWTKHSFSRCLSNLLCYQNTNVRAVIWSAWSSQPVSVLTVLHSPYSEAPWSSQHGVITMVTFSAFEQQFSTCGLGTSSMILTWKFTKTTKYWTSAQNSWAQMPRVWFANRCFVDSEAYQNLKVTPSEQNGLKCGP